MGVIHLEVPDVAAAISVLKAIARKKKALAGWKHNRNNNEAESF